MALGLPIASGKPWHRVMIPYGKKEDKRKLLDLLGSCVPGRFRPYQFAYQGHTVVFYVDDEDVANCLRRNSKAFNLTSQNTKMVIMVRRSSPPLPVMNDENTGKLTAVMSARYDPSVKVLDLTSLQDDDTLLQDGLFFPMNRPATIIVVASIIEKNIPELVGLNLSKNRMMSLSSMQDIVTRAPNVTSLNLGQNQLNRIEELDKIKHWKLTELILDGNPLCDKFSKTDYVRYSAAVT